MNPENPEMPPSDGFAAMETENSVGGSPSLVDRLMSTQPNVEPGDVSGAFDLDAPPEAHLACFGAKFAGQDGIPAVVHLVLAFVVVATDASDGSNSDGSADESEAELDLEAAEPIDPDARQFDGPQ